MKNIASRWSLVAGILTILFVVGALGCTKPDEGIAYWTCAMHPQIHEDGPGQCPICKMTLVPVKKAAEAHDASLQNSQAGVVISDESQSMAGIKTARVQKQNATFTLRTFGTVAFDPDLAVAQSEYLAALKSAGEFKKSAHIRLQLLGMSEDEISALEKSRKVSDNLYLPGKKSGLWVYATVYESDYDLVKSGTTAQIEIPGYADKKFSGIVKGITPVVDAGSRTLRARILIHENDPALIPNTYVNVSFVLDLGEQLVVPKSALIDTGLRKLVYTVQDGNHFLAQEVKTGAAWDDWQVITDGVNEGDTVASGALFLVDSEAQLKGGKSEAHQH